jgi:hypothetical protein
MGTRAHDAVVPERGRSASNSSVAMVASWSLAGGLAGGLLIVGFILAGRLHPDMLVAVTMATLGSIFGAVHGSILGVLARPARVERGRRWWEWAITGVGFAAAFMIAVAATLWLSLSAVAARVGAPSSWVILTAGVAVCLGVFIWATVLGWRSLESAYARWPDHGLGRWLVLGVFLLLTGVLLLLRPVLPGTGLQLSVLATIVMAAVATLWIALPAIIITLSVTRRRWLRLEGSGRR